LNLSKYYWGIDVVKVSVLLFLQPMTQAVVGRGMIHPIFAKSFHSNHFGLALVSYHPRPLRLRQYLSNVPLCLFVPLSLPNRQAKHHPPKPKPIFDEFPVLVLSGNVQQLKLPLLPVL
jgi:hypothetical protein